MNTYYIDFSGYCKVDAESADEAVSIFWNSLQAPSPNAYDENYKIEGTEIYSIDN